MQCPRCQADNPPDDRFCEQCGAPLEARCPQCRAPVRASARFCGKCGYRLAAPEAEGPTPPAATPAPASPSTIVAEAQRRFAPYTPKHLADKILTARSALEGERRQVTVLFADVAGFTALAERLDPEEVHRIINRCFELITAEIHRFEGTINQYTGDGVMALFGAPIAHEDSPRRAVHAALGIQRALRDDGKTLPAERGITLQMRIGLNTGPVVVGRIGDDLRMDYTAVGDTTNLAARMQQIARPGSVVVSEATQRLIAGFFETLDLGQMAVKGHTPIEAFEVLRTRGRRSRLEVAAERGLTPLVSRARELETIRERFAEVKAGRGQVVFVAGEAGIGKSRLVYEFRRLLAEAREDVTWLEGQCVSFGESIAFLPVIDQFRRNFGIEEFDGEPEIIAKVEHGMRRMGELEPHIPYVRSLLSVDPGEPGVTAMDALTRRRRTFEAVKRLTLRGAAIRPIVFVIEDLHWVDSSTEEYLAFLMDSVASARVMLVMTYRVGYTPPFRSHSFQTTLTLASLSEPEALTLASRVLGAERFPEELRDALIHKAEGVPLFVEEVTKTLLDLGVLQRENGGYRMARSMAEVGVPETIQGIIMARLDTLGEEGKRTVQLASVIGRQFLVRLLERISGLTSELEGFLAELKSLEIVYELGLLPEPAYIFKHAVIQDVAYNSLLVQRRKELHRSVAHAIEDLYADRLADHAEELAHHFALGEEWAKAFEYLVRAGDKAKHAYANQAALDFYARALDAAGRVPAVGAGKTLDVRQRRFEVWMVLARYADAVAEAVTMLELARAAGDRRGEAQALYDQAYAHLQSFRSENYPEARRCGEAARVLAEEIGDARLLLESLTVLAALDQAEGALEEAERRFREAIGISDRAGLRDATALTRMYLGAGANWRGEFRVAIAIAREAEEIAAGVHDGYAELVALAFRVLSYIGLGEYRDALDAIADGLAKARERDNGFIQGRLGNTLGWLHQELGDFEGALALDQESAELGKRIGNPNVEISALINVAYDHLNLGRPRRALPLLEETATRVEKFAFGAHRWRWSNHLSAYLAEALLATGEPGRALTYAERGLAQGHATGSRKYIARCQALRGAIALEAGDGRRAEADLAEALRLAREIEYPTLTWQGAHLLARAQAAQGKMEAALASARLAIDVIDRTTARVPEAALRATLAAWPRVQAARECLERLRRA